MNLLFALPGFHSFDRGAEVALLAVAAELAHSGDDVVVAGSGEPRPDMAYEYRQLRAVRREHFERFPKFPPLRSETAWEDASFALSLVSKMAFRMFDATITCAYPFTHWALRKYGADGPAHVYVTQNGDWPALSNTSEYRFFNCDGLICTNPDYFARNSERWRCSLIPNGVDLQRFRPGPDCRPEFGLPDSSPIVLMVSALIESKRVLDGIRVVAEVGDAHLVVAGDGPLRDDARQLASQLLPGRYTQLSVPAAQMPSLYRSADAFLHLSFEESFGNVFLEAWASGLPIVAHDNERLRWILGPGQFLCDTRSARALTGALRAALAATTLHVAPGIERFAWPVIAREYRDALSIAVAARRGGHA